MRAAIDVISASGLEPRLVIDASHGNSGKSEVRQAEVVREIAQSVARGSQAVSGVMMESFVKAGNQSQLPPGWSTGCP